MLVYKSSYKWEEKKWRKLPACDELRVRLNEVRILDPNQLVWLVNQFRN